MAEKPVLFLDMYGVILKESKGRFIPYTLSHFQEVEHERLLRQIRDERNFTKAGNGEITSDEFLSMLGYEDPQFHMKDYIENHLTLDEGFIPFAERFYQFYDFVLLSNDLSEWSRYITEYYRLDKYFQCKIVSGDVKCRKPDKCIYEIALRQVGRKPTECMFVDNSVKNLDAAKDLGIYPILFNRDREQYGGVIVNSFDELAMLLDGLFR